MTEKLFQALRTGTVPVYYGPDNAIDFLPNNESAIVLTEGKYDVHQTVQRMRQLASDPALYRRYTSWRSGHNVSPDWLARMDVGSVPTKCRVCIRAADLLARRLGSPSGGPFEQANLRRRNAAPCLTQPVYVRQRGRFWWVHLFLEQYTLAELRRQVLLLVPI